MGPDGALTIDEVKRVLEEVLLETFGYGLEVEGKQYSVVS